MPELQPALDRLRERFQALLHQDSTADLTSVLTHEDTSSLDVAQRQSLFRELLTIEIDHRRRVGIAVDQADYERRFAAHCEVIRAVFEKDDDAVDEGATVGLPATDQPTPVTLANRFTNLRFHARGGLGEVFRAHDEALHRDIAVKFIRPQRAAEPASREQFLLEGEITGRLDHPGVVPVYGLGETFDGRSFLAMRFIDGKTFRAVIDEFHARSQMSAGERRRELNRMLHHLAAACNVIAYAHSRGILHRDIKPDNIMIGRFNETLVVDWGLAVPIQRDERARASGEQTIHVSSGSGDSRSQPAAGTIGYFSPEALDSHTVACGTASDVYSLGGTLYYLLTGQRSVSGGLTPETLAAIRTGSFPPPRAIDRRVPKPLDAICRKAMAVSPAERYASPLHLAADLEAFVADEPVSVLKETLFERLRRTARNHRGLVLAVLGGLIAVAVVGGLSGVWLKRQADSERLARLQAQQAERQGVVLAANFAAQTVAGEIEVRWRILEALAADPVLRRKLGEVAAGSVADAAARAELQRWLLDRVQEYDGIGADSWFILSGQGDQLARRPFEERTIGKSFATRDYFHGQGRQLEEGATTEPLRESHLARAYESSSDGSLKIAYSVPVWPMAEDAGQGRPVGVLAMTAKAGQFSILHRGLSAGQVGVLVDLRGEGGDDPPGLILHHPNLSAVQIEAIERGEPARRFIPPETLARLAAQLKRTRMGHDDDAVEVAYVDDLWREGEARWIAAFEPVVIANRPAERTGQRYPGLVVIVQLCETPIPQPDSSGPSGRRSAPP